VKKKLASLDKRIQFGLIAFGLLLVAVGGYMFVVSPQNAQATKLQAQVDAKQNEVYHRKAQLRAGFHPPTIKTADLFRLARAMPDREDMPGIILTLSQVAQSAGIKFDLIEPVVNGVPTGLMGPFGTQRMHLLFNGGFYGLSDFLYRIRNLVAVRNGNLEASGRLFNVDTVTFSVTNNTFPQISAELFVDAYIYSSSGATTPPAATTPTTTTPSDSSTPTDTSTPPTGATAAGATP